MKENAYKDSYTEQYGPDGRDGFLKSLGEIRATQKAVTFTACEVRVLTVDDFEVAAGVDDELKEDTEKNTGLYFLVEGEAYPVRDWARLSFEKAFLTGEGIRRLPAKDYAARCNAYDIPSMPARERKVLFVQCGKATGLFSAGSRGFSELPAYECIKETYAYMDRNFPKWEFREGILTHEYTSCMVSLKNHAEEFRTVLEGVRYTPAFRLVTSDCGRCSVTIKPYLSLRSSCIPVPCLRVEHRGSTGMEEIRQALDQSYALLEKGVRDMEGLKKIPVRYPSSCMRSICRKQKLPKALALQAIDTFTVINGDTPCSALDVFMGICEVMQMLPADTAPEQRFRTENDIAGILAIRNWEQHDVPGIIY